MMRYASHYLYISGTQLYKKYAVELEDSCVSRIFSLTQEIESTVWVEGILILSLLPEYSVRTNQTFQELICEMTVGLGLELGDSIPFGVYAYHLSSVNLQDLTLFPSSRLKRL